MLRCVLGTVLLLAGAEGFSPSTTAPRPHRSLSSVTCSQQHSADVSLAALPRRAVVPLLGGAAILALRPTDADALVKGVAPPENFGKRSEGGKRVTNMQEARELGAKREAAMFDKEDGNFKTTKSGDRYRDVKDGTGAEVTMDTVADIKFRVLRLGKRSRDGLSGEASLVFSFGYGEDDDKESDVLRVDPASAALVPAMQETLLGIKAGGKRRVAVRPERGWRSKDTTCTQTGATEEDGPRLQRVGVWPGGGGLTRGEGQAIDVGTAVGLPGASVTEAETCMDVSRVPAPQTFQAKRKLARRFDESMLLEIEVVSVAPKAA